MARVAVYPADLGGCGYYRLIWASEALIAAGCDVKLVTSESAKDEQLKARWSESLSGERHVTDVVDPDADVVVFQRPLWRHQVEGMISLQQKGVRVVVEIDDDFSCVPPDNPAFLQTLPRENPRRNRNHLTAACELADLVTVSTPALARRYGGHGRCVILPNRVPLRYLEHEAARDPDKRWVGWSGSILTHAGDLEVTRGGVATAVRKLGDGVGFAVVGTGKGVGPRLGLADDVVAAGWLPIARMPEAMAMFDVGIVPLRQNAFNQAKSWLKGLEFISLGVPVVCSPTIEYRRLQQLLGEDAVRLAERPREWEYHIADLLHRGREVTVPARDTVMRHWTIEGNAEEWWAAWQSALVGRKR